jgi:hypothetical protein
MRDAPYARRRASHGQSTDNSDGCLSPAPGKGGIGAVGGTSPLWGPRHGGPAAGTLTGSTPATALVRAHLPGGSTQVEAPATRRVTPPERFRVRWCG